MIPVRVYLFVGLGTALIVGLVSGYMHAYSRGEDSVRDLWLKDRLVQQAEISRLQAAQALAATEVVTQYVDRIQVVREKAKTIVKEVPVYVPLDSCDLPGGFRVLHDAAATGSDLPDAASLADAAAAPAQDVAETVAENYSACHEISERLSALQGWISKQRNAQ